MKQVLTDSQVKELFYELRKIDPIIHRKNTIEYFVCKLHEEQSELQSAVLTGINVHTEVFDVAMLLTSLAIKLNLREFPTDYEYIPEESRMLTHLGALMEWYMTEAFPSKKSISTKYSTTKTEFLLKHVIGAWHCFNEEFAFLRDDSEFEEEMNKAFRQKIELTPIYYL